MKGFFLNMRISFNARAPLWSYRLCVQLVFELDVNIPHEVVTQVVAHVHLLDLPVSVLQHQQQKLFNSVQ